MLVHMRELRLVCSVCQTSLVVPPSLRTSLIKYEKCGTSCFFENMPILWKIQM